MLVPKETRACSDSLGEVSFQFDEGSGNFSGITQGIARVRGSRFADVDGDAAAYGCEARLVRKIVAKVKRKSTTECRLRKKMPDGTTLSGNGSRKHLDIAQIFHAAQSVPKLSELAANRKSN